MTTNEQHNQEIHENRKAWAEKPSLRKAYANLYQEIAENLAPRHGDSLNLELGSGMGNVKQFIPDCITSDIFANPWLDRQEDAYSLSFPAESLANLILFDVWHHLQYPANALKEASRTLKPKGRLLIMDPAMSALGLLVYGLFHHEPLGYTTQFLKTPLKLGDTSTLPYFAAQSSAHRLLLRQEIPALLNNWKIVQTSQITSLAYLASGGFRGPQLYPDPLLPAVLTLDRLLSYIPSLFAARLLVVLEKPA